MSMRSQALVEHHGIATGKEMSTADTLRRGLHLSPELPARSRARSSPPVCS